MKHKAEIKNLCIPMQQDLGRKNEELEELYLLEKCFSEAEKMRREHRLYSQVRLTVIIFLR